MDSTKTLIEITRLIDALPYTRDLVFDDLRSFWTTGSLHSLLLLKSALGAEIETNELVRLACLESGMSLEESVQLERDVRDLWSDDYDKLPYNARPAALQVILRILKLDEPPSNVFSLVGRTPSGKDYFRRDDKKVRNKHNTRVMQDYKLKT